MPFCHPRIAIQRRRTLHPDHRQSLDSVKTGDSLIFPDHKDIEVLKYTPIRKDTFIKIEDTFWSKKRKLIPDYSVMEEIDKHVLAVSRCFETVKTQTPREVYEEMAKQFAFCAFTGSKIAVLKRRETGAVPDKAV